MEAFKAFYQTKKEIELELRKWNRDRFMCRARDIKKEASNMVCELVNGRYDYLSAVGRYACDLRMECCNSRRGDCDRQRS